MWYPFIVLLQLSKCIQCHWDYINKDGWRDMMIKNKWTNKFGSIRQPCSFFTHATCPSGLAGLCFIVFALVCRLMKALQSGASLLHTRRQWWSTRVLKDFKQEPEHIISVCMLLAKKIHMVFSTTNGWSSKIHLPKKRRNIWYSELMTPLYSIKYSAHFPSLCQVT